MSTECPNDPNNGYGSHNVTHPLTCYVDGCDCLGLAVNRALLADEFQRLAEWALIGPVQRAALESFAERLLAAERERRALLVRLVRELQEANESAPVRLLTVRQELAWRALDGEITKGGV